MENETDGILNISEPGLLRWYYTPNLLAYLVCYFKIINSFFFCFLFLFLFLFLFFLFCFVFLII